MRLLLRGGLERFIYLLVSRFLVLKLVVFPLQDLRMRLSRYSHVLTRPAVSRAGSAYWPLSRTLTRSYQYERPFGLSGINPVL